MIVLGIKCASQEDMFKARETMHNALVGSPAYINSEIAICDCEEDKTKFLLVVGNSNDNDVEFGVDFESFKPVEIDEDSSEEEEGE